MDKIKSRRDFLKTATLASTVGLIPVYKRYQNVSDLSFLRNFYIDATGQIVRDVDLQERKILEFLNNRGELYFDEIEILSSEGGDIYELNQNEKIRQIADISMSDSSGNPITEEQEYFSNSFQYYELSTEQNNDFQNLRMDVPQCIKFDLGFNFKLFLKQSYYNNITDELRNELTSEFTLLVQKPSNLIQSISDLFTKYNIDPSNIFVYQTYKLYKTNNFWDDCKTINQRTELNNILTCESQSGQSTIFDYSLNTETDFCEYLERNPVIIKPIGQSRSRVFSEDYEDDLTSPNVNSELERRNHTLERLGCEGIDYEEKRVGTIFSWPQFRITWLRKKVKIGCSTVSIKVPRLQIRTKKKVAYAAVGYLKSTYVELNVKRCLREAVIATGLFILLTQSYQAALASFKAVFTECIRRNLTKLPDCLSPRIFFQNEYSNWSSV